LENFIHNGSFCKGKYDHKKSGRNRTPPSNTRRQVGLEFRLQAIRSKISSRAA
jgi:hypothetical protein